MSAASFKPKSKKGEKPAFVWVLLDEGGSFKAVCCAASNTKDALNPMFLAKAMQTAKRAFEQNLAKGQSPTNIIGLDGQPLSMN